MKRTHHCAELTAEQIGQSVTLVGWIDSLRDHGGLIFIDLRDREGITQIAIDPNHQPDLAKHISSLREESVITVTGKVVARPSDTINSKIATGSIEVKAQLIQIENIAEVLPFQLNDAHADKVGEETRLKYRYLDLRRPKKLKLLRMRHQAGHTVRQFLDEQGFTEVELPTLFKSTPEGAREFLVPSRLNPGSFYALAQSPQQYKQMLMVAGIERYYSFARCYRDEDLRADRQPEFTQIDIEMSFIDREDIYALIEGILKRIWKNVLNVDIPTPFLRMPYQEAMDRFGVDKPDTRFGIEIKDFTDVFATSEFKAFAGEVAAGGVVRAINAKGMSSITQGELKALEDTAKTLGAKGLGFIKVENGEWKSPITKFLSEFEKTALTERLNVQEGDLILFAAAKWERTCAILGRVRLDVAELMVQRNLLTIPADQFNFLWVIDFPLMILDEDEERYVSAHHPFTAPVEEDAHLLDSAPDKVRGQHYDIVLNGTELGGGSIRIHQPALQKKVFEDVLKIPADIVKSRFGYMLEAFTFGAPPHGGIALGFDRVCALLCGQTSVREVIAFPKTQRGQDLMSESPGTVTAKQLKDVFILSTAVTHQ
jgi:aspartyl-tRNA synthetase